MNEYLVIALKQGMAILAGSLITYLITCIKKKKAELDAKDEQIKELLENDQAVLRQDIVNTYYLWHEKGYMPAVVKDSIISCHERYHKSGGNGFIDSVMERVKAMPTEIK